MKKRKVDPWFPFWIDKWLFGSTRIELLPDERSVFVDLMSLSKKDDGYIRANEGVPYLEKQLCGLLNIEPELLQRTIAKCIKFRKMKRLRNKTYLMLSHENYKLSERQQRRIEKEMADEADTMSEKPDAKRENKRENEKDIKRENKQNDDGQKDFGLLFEKFWDAYPKKVHKQVAREKFMILAKKGLIEDVASGFNGYVDYLKHKRVNEDFEQEPMNPATFLMKERWKDYVGFKYKERL